MAGRERCDEIVRMIDEALADGDPAPALSPARVVDPAPPVAREPAPRSLLGRWRRWAAGRRAPAPSEHGAPTPDPVRSHPSVRTARHEARSAGARAWNAVRVGRTS